MRAFHAGIDGDTLDGTVGDSQAHADLRQCLSRVEQGSQSFIF
jgi:hypothetical protein